MAFKVSQYRSVVLVPHPYIHNFLSIYGRIIPVPFAKEHKDMIAHCRNLMSNELVTIYPKEKFDKLITSLITAVDNEGTLDKEATSYPDIFDAFRLPMRYYHFEQQ
jgi:hypothetical protein